MTAEEVEFFVEKIVEKGFLRCIARTGDLIGDVFNITGLQIGLKDARAVVKDLDGVQVFSILAVTIGQTDVVPAAYPHFGSHRKIRENILKIVFFCNREI